LVLSFLNLNIGAFFQMCLNIGEKREPALKRL